MKRLLAAAAVAVVGLVAAVPASARGSVGISLSFAEPGFYGSVNLGAPVYAPAPIYYAPPAPVYYAPPAPVYYEAPARIYYDPAPSYYAPRWQPPREDHHQHRHGNRNWRDSDRDGVPDSRDRHPRHRGWY